MQTFLPFSDFEQNARVLDKIRLNNQANEAKAILRSLLSGRGWIHHPAVKMWAGYEHSLGRYYDSIIGEFIRRGGNNTRPVSYKLINFDSGKNPFTSLWHSIRDNGEPLWLGDDRLHSSHRSVLQWKEIVNCEPEWYLKFNWVEQPKYLYFWPSNSK